MNIALAIIVDRPMRHALIAQRLECSHLAGLWEFPGGKIEEGETAAECAVREVLEETDLNIAIDERWEPIIYSYPDRTVTLHPFLCRVDASEHTQYRWHWVPITELDDYSFPDANAPILSRLKDMATA